VVHDLSADWMSFPLSKQQYQSTLRKKYITAGADKKK